VVNNISGLYTAYICYVQGSQFEKVADMWWRNAVPDQVSQQQQQDFYSQGILICNIYKPDYTHGNRLRAWRSFWNV